MSNSSFLTAFNNVISQFIDDLIKTFPEEREFRKFKTGFSLLKSTNNKKIVQVFKFYIENYREQISNRDDNFFIVTDSETLSDSDDNSIANLLDKLKVYWKLLSENNKDKIWQYLNTFIILSNKI